MKENKNHMQSHDSESTILTYFLTLFIYSYSLIYSLFQSTNIHWVP